MTELPKITRHFYLTLFIAAIIIFVGGTLAEGSEVGGMLVVVGAFVVGLTLLDVLEQRDKRREQNRD